MIDAREYIAKREPLIHRFHRLNCAPTVVIDMDVDIEPALAWKKELASRPESRDVAVTLNHIVLKATAMALREHILFNYDYNGKYRLIPNDKIDIRSPVEIDDLPVHVVVPDTDEKSVFEIAATYAQNLEKVREIVDRRVARRLRFHRLPLLPRLLAAVRTWSIPVRDFVPAWERKHFDLLRKFIGSFMVTNVGTLGVTACHGQLVKPSLAALIVLAIREDVEIRDGKPASRKVLPLALEFDHKMADATNAARFLKVIKRNLEEPEKYCEPDR